MDGWMDGWVDGWTNGWTDGWTDRQTDEHFLINNNFKFNDQWTDGWMEGWMNGWKKKKFINAVYSFMVVVYMYIFIHVISNNCTCAHVFIIYSQIVNPGDLFDNQVANFTQYQHFIFL